MPDFTLFLTTIFVCLTVSEDSDSPRSQENHGKVEIIGHRGASYDAPENTLSAVRLSWNQAADATEIDIYVTQDNHIVALHDRNLKRTTGVDAEVQDLTLEEIQRLDAGSWKDPKWAGEPIPTLAACVATLPDSKRLFVEIKCGLEILPPLETFINDSKIDPKQIAFISFDYTVIRSVKKSFPQFKSYWISSFKKDEATESWTPQISDLIKKAKAAGLDGLDLDARGPVNASTVRQIREQGLELYVWTVNDPEKAREMVHIGVQGITTDRPAFLRDKLK